MVTAVAAAVSLPPQGSGRGVMTAGLLGGRGGSLGGAGSPELGMGGSAELVCPGSHLASSWVKSQSLC
jgi:hypothetical protein